MKLKEQLIFEIMTIDNFLSDKYSKSYINLKTLFEIEDDIDKDLKKQFNQIEAEYLDFLDGFPLEIIEIYYYRNKEYLNKYLNINYKNLESYAKYRVSDVYMKLELFYNRIFLIASKIANLYNLEVKVNQNKNNDNIF